MLGRFNLPIIKQKSEGFKSKRKCKTNFISFHHFFYLIVSFRTAHKLSKQTEWQHFIGKEELTFRRNISIIIFSCYWFVFLKDCVAGCDYQISALPLLTGDYLLCVVWMLAQAGLCPPPHSASLHRPPLTHPKHNHSFHHLHPCSQADQPTLTLPHWHHPDTEHQTN